MIQVLLIEDDETIAMGIAFALKKEGYIVHLASNMQEAKKIFNKEIKEKSKKAFHYLIGNKEGG